MVSILAKGLGIDWRLGACLFESLLLDHEWGVNVGNWAYNAGVGNDPRDRRFKTVTQGESYDVDNRLIRMWLPELAAALPAATVSRPWDAPPGAWADGFRYGIDYPRPLVDVTMQIGDASKPRDWTLRAKPVPPPI